MRREASEPEHDEALGAIASAEKATNEPDGPKVLEYFKSVQNRLHSGSPKQATSRLLRCLFTLCYQP
jgi:hypothetical protein